MKLLARGIVSRTTVNLGEIDPMANYDFSNIGNRQQIPTPIDPEDIFRSCTVSDRSVNDLWLGQGDALREWHGDRHLEDVGIVLNTGAGKTLVGLLIAQSLVNETQRQVVYACSSIQLVEQTARKARGYGIDVATYYRGQFVNEDAYYRAKSPCITTYQALFIGRTRFNKDDISAVIFDDAHTADNILRDQFSLQITRQKFPDTYDELVSLFSEYHRHIGRDSSYSEITTSESSRLFLVPPFEVRRHVKEIRRIISQARLNEFTETMFSWEHIIDHEELCCWLISSSEVTITPVTVPVSTLPYFRRGTRRVYLSATLNAPDTFARAFGRVPEKFVAPPTPAGECERMIVIPSMLSDVEAGEDVNTTIDIIENKKTFILVPSYYRSNAWKSIASPPPTHEVSERLNSFRGSDSPEKLILTARYDGIDLPGDTCRVMVIDDLPAGSGPLERFQRDSLNMDNSTRSSIASRIVQSFGRISRGMSDHGVVLLTGKDLVNWIAMPRNRVLLPEFLQKQINLGEEVSSSVSTSTQLLDAINGCLNRDPGWIKAYSNYMRNMPNPPSQIDSDTPRDIALAEASFGESLWKRDFPAAAKVLSDIQDQAVQFSQHAGGWLTMWCGYAVEMAGNQEAGHELYRRAYTLNLNIPRPASLQQNQAVSAPQQVVNIAEQMQVGGSHGIKVKVPPKLQQHLADLNGNGTVPQTEEALRCLGQYLGLDSTRPDNEYGTGPDVLWLGDDGIALIMELKTTKGESSSYTKHDLGQLRDHVQWVSDKYQPTKTVQMFVGPNIAASDSSNPSPDMFVVELEQFDGIGKKLISTLQDISGNTLQLTLVQELNNEMKTRGLLWPDVLESMDKTTLFDS